MRLRLGYALELVAVLAAGLATARWALEFPQLARSTGLVRRLDYLSKGFIVGASLAGGLGLWLESARRRSPSTWGVGRRTWSVASLTVVIGAIFLIGTQSAISLKYRGDVENVYLVTRHAWQVTLVSFSDCAVWAIVAMGLTSLLEGRPGDLSPDAREWVGRALLIFILGQALAVRIVAIYQA